ncbi:MAG TPA: hypothetical protein VL860_15120, partial [Planctomycetota bacterium]|nr:hypothetical protein [Planctomycetota bacterium]
RLLSEGEMLVVAPGQNLTVESPAQSERRLPVIDQITGGVRWVVLPAREKQVVSIRWLDTSNIKKLVEIEMLEGDLFLAANPREQPDLSLAVRGRKSGLVFEGPPSSPAAPVVGATGVTPSAGAAATGASAGAPAGANAASTWTAVDHRTLKLHLEVDASLRVVGYGHSLLPAGDDPTLALGIHLFASLRPGATLQNSGETTLVIEQYSTRAAGRWSDAPTRVVLPPETSLSTNGGRYDLRHFYIPEPGQPAGPARVEHIGANPPADARMNAGLDTSGARAADATAGVLP